MPDSAASGRARGPSPELLQSTVRARTILLSEIPAAGTVSATTAALVKQAMQTMMLPS